MKISNNNFNHHYYVAKDKKSDDKTVADEKTDNNKPPDDEKIDNRSSLDYLINKDRDRARALLKQQDKPKIRNKRDSNDPNIITVIANKQPEWLSSRESSYASDSLQRAIVASQIQAERSTSAAINDDLIKILTNEQHARSLLKKANSLAIIGGAVTPAGQMAPVFSSSGAGSLVFNNSTGVSLITQLNQAVNALTTMASEVALKAISKGFVIASIFYSPKAGEGSNLAQGRTLEQFLSLSVPAKTMGLTNKQALQQAANTSGQIAMPIRGKLVVTDDKINVMVIKTDEIKPVTVINAVQDAKIGLYIHSLPKNSHQTSTINVVTAPAKESLLTGQPHLIPTLPAVPVTVRNNPTSSQYAPIPLSVTTEFQDVILVYPEAAKMEPVYITYGSKTQSMVDQAAQQLDIANKSFAAIDKQYQAELSVLNRLQTTPEGLTLSDPAKYPLIYQQTAEQRKMTDREIAVRDMSLIKVLQQQGIKAYILEALKKESQQKTIPGLAPILVAALYETLGHRLLDADKKIAQQQKKLQPLMASRKTAEENKKAAAGKVEAEIKRLFVSEQNLKNVNNRYYPAPATKLLADYLGLQASPAKTLLDDGVSQKPRWTDATGETIYEWNSLNGSLETYKPGHWETELGKGGKEARVWVVESVINPATGLYGITLPDKDGKQGRTVLISPLKAPGADGLGHLLHPEKQQVVILNTGNNQPIKTPIVRVYPNLIPPDIETPVTVPPLENGYQPLYVMFNNPRHLPGVVTGNGQKVTGNWLNKAGEELGAPIPRQIADKLRGKKFASFDQFRQAFWQEVAKDPELSKQFIPANKTRMSQGLAPRAKNEDTIGGRRSFELHHNIYISNGGKIYDIDNLSVTTPKKHIEIHKGT